MPLYDFECQDGHRFESIVPMDRRQDPIQCEGRVTAMPLSPDAEPGERRCMRMAERIISHSSPDTMLDHGYGANRDAAMAGKYDPLRPSSRGVRK